MSVNSANRTPYAMSANSVGKANSNPYVKKVTTIVPYCSACEHAGQPRDVCNSHNINWVYQAGQLRGSAMCPTKKSHNCDKCHRRGHFEKYCTNQPWAPRAIVCAKVDEPKAKAVQKPANPFDVLADNSDEEVVVQKKKGTKRPRADSATHAVADSATHAVAVPATVAVAVPATVPVPATASVPLSYLSILNKSPASLAPPLRKKEVTKVIHLADFGTFPKASKRCWADYDEDD